MINGLLEGIECRVNCDYDRNRNNLESLADRIIYTGPIDEYFKYRLGRLEYRSLRFEQEDLPVANYQGNAIVNYTSAEVPYTRVVEHKWFDIHNADAVNAAHTVITREYPEAFTLGMEPYYPINDERNMALYKEYVLMAREEARNVIFDGRLGSYKYLDMDKTIEAAMILSKKEDGCKP